MYKEKDMKREDTSVLMKYLSRLQQNTKNLQKKKQENNWGKCKKKENTSVLIKYLSRQQIQKKMAKKTLRIEKKSRKQLGEM